VSLVLSIGSCAGNLTRGRVTFSHTIRVIRGSSGRSPSALAGPRLRKSGLRGLRFDKMLAGSSSAASARTNGRELMNRHIQT